MRPVFLPLACVAISLCAVSASAASFEDRLIAHLRLLGYSDITLSFTLLGRAQIIAVGQDDTREIVLNPRTGEILRDFAQTTGNDGTDPVAVVVAPIVLPLEVEPSADAPVETPVDDLAVETRLSTEQIESAYTEMMTETDVTDPPEEAPAQDGAAQAETSFSEGMTEAAEPVNGEAAQ